MPRLTRLEEVLFPVEEHPVFVSVKTNSHEQRLPVPEKKAIVNGDNDRVLGIVSRGYRLVSNQEALDMAYECCKVVFPETKPAEWMVNTTDAPATGRHCFIDIEHKSSLVDLAFVPVRDLPDAFRPFIRLTNSYNGLRALAFDIGYYRVVCTNGMILSESIISFKFTHLRNVIGDSIRFEIAKDKLDKMKASLGEYFGALRKCAVRRVEFEPLMCAVLLIRKPKSAKPDSREAEDWIALEAHIKTICERYADDLGENAYAVFNAVTEFASQPPDNRCVFRDRNSLQRRAGVWLTEFSIECRKPKFDLLKYIETLRKNAVNGTKATAAQGTPG